jgi:TRAP-type C4-dicarboxylate transport system permease small subunit
VRAALRLFAWTEARAADVAAIAMLAMVLIVTVDVVMRYSFNAPLSWSYDLVSMYLMPGAVFLMLALVQRNAHHVNVDIFYRLLPQPLQRAASLVAFLCSGIVMAIVAILAAMRAWTAIVNDEVVSGPIEWPVWIGPSLLAVGAALFVLRCLAGIVETARGRALPPAVPEDDPLAQDGRH